MDKQGGAQLSNSIIWGAIINYVRDFAFVFMHL